METIVSIIVALFAGAIIDAGAALPPMAMVRRLIFCSLGIAPKTAP